MKKYLFLFILLFIFIPNVKAGTINGSINGANMKQTPDLIYYSPNGNQINTTFVKDELSLSGYYKGSLGNNLENVVSFNLGESLPSGYLYSLTLYIGTQKNANQGDVHPKIGQGNWHGGAMTSYNQGGWANGCQADVFSYTHSYNGNYDILLRDPGAENLYPSTTLTKIIYVIFKSNCNYPYVALPVNYGSSPGDTYFWGYNLSSLGNANNLSYQQVKDIVNNATSNIASYSYVNDTVWGATSHIQDDIANSEKEIKSTITEESNKINDSITSEEEPDIDLDLDETSNTPISDLILFPITLLNKLINTIGDNTCSSYTLPFFYDTSITFPCFQLSDYLGTSITNSIDLFICLFMCYNLAMLFISIFEDITSLRDTYDNLYEPKHADTGYKPKHGKE